MAEEFISDIIGAIDAPKVESGVVAEEKPAVAVETPPAAPEGMPQVNADVKAPVVESDDIKALASQLGWREDHKGEDAVDAKTYILKSKDIQKSMSQHNKDLKNQLTGLNGSVAALQEHNENVYKAELKKLTGEITGLKKERREAIELADVDKVEELDSQIAEVQQDIDKPKPVEKKVQEVTDNPIYDKWIADNQWYLNDDDMAKFADTVAGQYAGAPLDRVYAIVRNKVQEVFPDKFGTAETVGVVKVPVGPKSPVERSSAKVSEGTFTKASLTPNQRQNMQQFVGLGIMTEEQYVNDIAKMQG